MEKDMLTAAEEAALIGVSQSAVSRARSQHPTHPANGPLAATAQVGQRLHVTAPRAEILAWWPTTGSGLSPAEWQTLQSIQAGAVNERWGTRRVISVLTARGLLSDDGQLTDTAWALLARTTPTNHPTPKDQP